MTRTTTNSKPRRQPGCGLLPRRAARIRASRRRTRSARCRLPPLLLPTPRRAGRRPARTTRRPPGPPTPHRRPGRAAPRFPHVARSPATAESRNPAGPATRRRAPTRTPPAPPQRGQRFGEQRRIVRTRRPDRHVQRHGPTVAGCQHLRQPATHTGQTFRLDLDGIAEALSDQTNYEHRRLINPDTGEILFWTSGTGIDGKTPVDLDELDELCIDPLPSYVWYQDMADFAELVGDERRLTRAIQGKGLQNSLPARPHDGAGHRTGQDQVVSLTSHVLRVS